MPSETIACIEQNYVGKFFKVPNKSYSETMTKEKIRSLFNVYITAINQVFGGRAIIMQKTRAIKGNAIVPIVSYEYVYNNCQGISTYTDEGYYAVTVNGYRIRDILDSGVLRFTNSINGAKDIVDGISLTLDVPKAAVKRILVNFFYHSAFETFPAFLDTVLATGKSNVFEFDVCASYTCSFGEGIPEMGDAIEIYHESKAAQDQSLACDEVDILGWKNPVTQTATFEKRLNDFCTFFDHVLAAKDIGPTPADDTEFADECDECDGCDECCAEAEQEPEKENRVDPLKEIKEDVAKPCDSECTCKPRGQEQCITNKRIPIKDYDDEEVDKKDEDADVPSDPNTVLVISRTENGKTKTERYYDEAAKKKISEMEDSKNQDDRIGNLEKAVKFLSQPPVFYSPFHSILFRDLFDSF
jgi:hypothetical protein